MAGASVGFRHFQHVTIEHLQHLHPQNLGGDS